MNDDQSHSVVEKLRLLAPWVEPRGARLVAPPATPLPVEVAAALRAPYAVLQAPAAVAYKLWPLAHWRALVAALLERGLQVVLTGAPSAGDRALVAAVADGHSSDQVLDLAGRLDLNQVGALLRGAALYVGGDTSITHLAAACDIPVVALYGPIDPRYFGPWPPNPTLAVPYRSHALVQRAGPVTVLQGAPACVPCNRAGCEDRNDSAERLPADVAARARDRRSRPDSRSRALNDNEAMSAGDPSGTRRGRQARPGQGRHPRRRLRHPHLRGNQPQAEADDRDRRPADPLAHHEDLLGRTASTTS